MSSYPRTVCAFISTNNRGRQTARERIESEMGACAPVLAPDEHEALVDQLYDDFGRSRGYWMQRLGLTVED